MTNLRNVTRNLFLFGLFLAQGTVVTFAQQDTQQLFSHCSNANLSGGYGFIVTGTTSNAEQYSLVGRFTADGKGGVTGSSTESVNGTILRPTFTGTYTVKADCTGTANLTFDDGGAAPLEFIIVDDGKTVDIMVAGPAGVPGENEVGTATRQFNKAQTP